MEPTNLRVEHLEEPLGLDASRPRLSWRLPVGSRTQVAYRIRAGEWDSHRVESDQSVLVPYKGPPLSAGQRVSWSVKVWTDTGESGWADSAWWEMGLLKPADWLARWIEPNEGQPNLSQGPHPPSLFRGEFAVESSIERARVYATAHGIYELFINGNRVGDIELTPGFTSYWSNLQVQTFDITSLLVPGDNVVGAIVSDGWFRGQNGAGRLTGIYGDSVALLVQLDVHCADGSLVRFGTGPDWRVGTSAIRAADLFEGEVIDFGQEVKGWCEPGGQVHDWSPAETHDFDMSRLRSSPAPSVRQIEQLKPVSVTSLGSGRQIVDLGKNINGWVRLTDTGPAGTALTLTYGEALDGSGDVTQDHLVAYDPAFLAQPKVANLRRPFQVDSLTSAGGPDECFDPRHTTHGFRYVRVEGHPRILDTDCVTGVVVHTDLRRTGWFECSDERINKMHEAAVWSFRGNACDIPTDCPTRERAGWTGDWQIFIPTAAFLYDVAGFSTKWLRDLAAEQHADGRVPDCVPNTLTEDLTKLIGITPGSAGWGDAAVIVPWEVYRAYGDRDLLEEQWNSMAAWVDYAARNARERRHPNRTLSRPRAAAHEQFIWDSGFHFGEWLEPGDIGIISGDVEANRTAHVDIDHGDVATAYLHYSSRLIANIARILNRREDAVRYSKLASATRAAWQSEFVRTNAMLSRHTQAAYVRALAFDLVSPELRPQLAARLVELVRKADMHLGTGFLATPYLLPVLADTGYLDLAYELLFQDTEPSWLTMIDRGATTIWEAWNGVDKNGVPHHSLNHYSKGAVISFLHRYVAGIRLLDYGPAYRHFQIIPMPGGGIVWARAAHDSPYGRIESSWQLAGHAFTLDVTVPPGSTAQVILPDGREFDALPGTTHYDTRMNIMSNGMTG